MALQQFDPGLLEWQPCDPIQLREFLKPSGTFRPFQREGVADGTGDVEIGMHGEHREHLATGLAQRPELDPRPRRDRPAEFLGELTPRGVPRILICVVLAFWDRPRAVVPAGPERSAGVSEEDLGDAVAEAVNENSRTEDRHGHSVLAGRGPDNAD